MTLTLKAIKHAKFASQETECFSATVCWCGKPIGTAENQGVGGSTCVQLRGKLAASPTGDVLLAYLRQRSIERAKAILANPYVEGWMRDMANADIAASATVNLVGLLESEVDALLGDHLDAKERQRTEKFIAKQKANAVANGWFLGVVEEPGQVRTIPGKTWEAVVAMAAKKGIDPARLRQILILDEAASVEIPARFQMKAGTAPNNVTIVDTQTGRVLAVALCDLRGARLALATFCH